MKIFIFINLILNINCEYETTLENNETHKHHVHHKGHTLQSQIENWDSDDVLFAIGEMLPEYRDDMIDDKE